MTDVVYIAKCPTHGLHGERQECFVCGGPVEQVAMMPVEGALTDEMLDRAWGHYSHPDEDEPESAEIEALRVAILAAGPWTGVKPLDRAKAIRVGIDALHERKFCVGADTCEAEPTVVAVIDALIAMQGGDAR